jgi:hypothetical protein
MRTIRALFWTLTLGAGVFAPAAAEAQSSIIEANVGRAWFIDESPIPHSVVGGAIRGYVTPRVSLGFGLTHMRGPGHDRDLFAQALVSADLLSPATRRKVVPYVTLAGGLLHHTNRIGTIHNISHTGLAFGLSAGARVRMGDRWFIAPEAGVGIEAHTRIGISVGLLR